MEPSFLGKIVGLDHDEAPLKEFLPVLFVPLVDREALLRIIGSKY